MTGTAAVIGQTCLQQCGRTRLSGDAFCWLGLLNVFMLVAFLAASLRRDPPADGDPERSGEGANTPRDTTAARPPALRASDAEREATAAMVSRAMADGRLTLDEGVARLDAAYRARERHELEALVADLPPEPQRRPGRWSGPSRDLRDFGVLAVVAAAVAQALAGMWELWPIAAAALLPMAVLRPRLAGTHGESPGRRRAPGS